MFKKLFSGLTNLVKGLLDTSNLEDYVKKIKVKGVETNKTLIRPKKGIGLLKNLQSRFALAALKRRAKKEINYRNKISKKSEFGIEVKSLGGARNKVKPTRVLVGGNKKLYLPKTLTKLIKYGDSVYWNMKDAQAKVNLISAIYKSLLRITTVDIANERIKILEERIFSLNKTKFLEVLNNNEYQFKFFAEWYISDIDQVEHHLDVLDKLMSQMGK